MTFLQYSTCDSILHNLLTFVPYYMTLYKIHATPIDLCACDKDDMPLAHPQVYRLIEDEASVKRTPSEQRTCMNIISSIPNSELRTNSSLQTIIKDPHPCRLYLATSIVIRQLQVPILFIVHKELDPHDCNHACTVHVHVHVAGNPKCDHLCMYIHNYWLVNTSYYHIPSN